MRRAPVEDLYALLGVPPDASVAEIRRAYRLLALRYHPDRAGSDSTGLFQAISDAYRVLSVPATRFAYDLERDAAMRPAAGPFGESRPGPTVDWRRGRTAGSSGGELIARLCGALDALIARGAARRLPDGLLELMISSHEAVRGGTAAIDLPSLVACPTCGGVAKANAVWCVRCQFAGTVLDRVTICIPIAPYARDGTVFSVAVDPMVEERVRVRLRVA